MGYVLTSDFWKYESNCALLDRNNAFVTRENSRQMAELVKQTVMNIPSSFKKENESKLNATITEVGIDEYDRIFKLDAVRTFSSEMFRKLHEETLVLCYSLIHDYHQGLGFLVAFLRLFVSRKETALLTYYLEKNCCNGYYMFQNQNYLRDCRVFDKLLQQQKPKLYDHLNKYILTGQWLSKYWIGIGVHVLPFKNVYEILRSIVELPTLPRLIAISFAIINTLEDSLLKINNPSQLLELIRFDSNSYRLDYKLSYSHQTIFDDITECLLYIDLDCKNINELKEKIGLELKLETETREKDLKNLEIMFSDEE